MILNDMLNSLNVLKNDLGSCVFYKGDDRGRGLKFIFES